MVYSLWPAVNTTHSSSVVCPRKHCRHLLQWSSKIRNAFALQSTLKIVFLQVENVCSYVIYTPFTVWNMHVYSSAFYDLPAFAWLGGATERSCDIRFFRPRRELIKLLLLLHCQTPFELPNGRYHTRQMQKINVGWWRDPSRWRK